jgi:hypothetical protein
MQKKSEDREKFRSWNGSHSPIPGKVERKARKKNGMKENCKAQSKCMLCFCRTKLIQKPNDRDFVNSLYCNIYNVYIARHCLRPV